jgi:hypothetical protein
MHKNQKYALLLLLVPMSLVGWYLWGFNRTPHGQPPLTSLTPNNLGAFKRQFNDAADRTRLVLLLSPT